MVLRFCDTITKQVEEYQFSNDLVREWGHATVSYDGNPSSPNARPQIKVIYRIDEHTNEKGESEFFDFITFKRHSASCMRGTVNKGPCMYISLRGIAEEGFFTNEGTYIWNPKYYDVFLMTDEGKTYQRL